LVKAGVTQTNPILFLFFFFLKKEKK